MAKPPPDFYHVISYWHFPPSTEYGFARPLKLGSAAKSELRDLGLAVPSKKLQAELSKQCRLSSAEYVYIGVDSLIFFQIVIITQLFILVTLLRTYSVLRLICSHHIRSRSPLLCPLFTPYSVLEPLYRKIL